MPALNSGHTVGYVRYPTLIRSIRIELSLELVGRHDTGLAFACPRAPVPDLGLYPDTLHQSPDSVHSALLPAIPQVHMDLAITINATGLQPELFNLSRQSQIYLVALRMRLLKPGVKATGMNIQHPTEQTNRPATAVVTDKGVPQSDSFAKYAAVDSIGQRNSYVKTWGCGGFLNETNIYSRGKSLCF